MNKIKKIFESAVWWLGVVMVGLLLGLSLQFVRAWTEPTPPAPDGNVGAPVNTGIQTQSKTGLLGLLGGLLTPRINTPNDTPAAGEVLTSLDNMGTIAWAQSQSAGGGGCYVSYSGNCLSGFRNEGSAGDWGYCIYTDQYTGRMHFRPPGGGCYAATVGYIGTAIVCCK